MLIGANVVQITSSGVFLFGGLAILRLLLFSTKNVSSIRIFARGNPGAVRTALKMYAFLRTKYLRIAAGLNTPYSFRSPIDVGCVCAALRIWLFLIPSVAL